MTTLIKVRKGPTHKRFIKTCNETNIKVKALPGILDFLWFEVKEDEDLIITLCKVTNTCYYPLEWINYRSRLRTQNYERIYGEL